MARLRSLRVTPAMMDTQSLSEYLRLSSFNLIFCQFIMWQQFLTPDDILVKHSGVEVGLDRDKHHVTGLDDGVVVHHEGHAALLPPGLEAAAGGAGQDVAGLY